MAAKKKAKKKAAASRKAPAKKSAARKAARKSPARVKAASSGIHEIVHWEIQAQYPGKLQKFYCDALGWSIDANNPMQYGMVSSGGKNGINGGIGGSAAPGSRVVVYAAVKSIPEILARIESLGGKTIMPRTDVGPVIMGLFVDPEGNTMGLVEG